MTSDSSCRSRACSSARRICTFPRMGGLGLMNCGKSATQPIDQKSTLPRSPHCSLAGSACCSDMPRHAAAERQVARAGEKVGDHDGRVEDEPPRDLVDSWPAERKGVEGSERGMAGGGRVLELEGTGPDVIAREVQLIGEARFVFVVALLEQMPWQRLHV